MKDRRIGIPIQVRYVGLDLRQNVTLIYAGGKRGHGIRKFVERRSIPKLVFEHFELYILAERQ